jgi:hypothetical protein
LGKIADAVVSEAVKWVLPKVLLLGAPMTVGAWAVLARLEQPVSLGAVFGVSLSLCLVAAILLVITGRLQSLRPHADAVDLRHDGTGYVHGFAQSAQALVVPFRNSPTFWRWRINPDEEISAQVDFGRKDLIQRAIAGCWLNERSSAVRFPVGQARDLIIAIRAEDGFGVPESTVFSDKAVEGVTNALEAHQRGTYTRLNGIDDGIYRVRVTLTGSRGLSMKLSYKVSLRRTGCWVEEL